MFEITIPEPEFIAKIKVACIGADARTINKISKLSQVEFSAVDGDENITKNRADFEKFFEGADLIFIVAGAKTSATPALAEIAKSSGALTVAVVTLPFDVETLRPHVDTFVAVPNDNNADEIIFKTVQSIFSLVTMPGIIVLDLYELNIILKNSGEAYVGIGEAKTVTAAAISALIALDYPLMKNKIDGAYSILINFTGAEYDFQMVEVSEAATTIQDAANEDAEIMWGMSVDESLGDTVRVVVIATRFDGQRKLFSAPINFNQNLNDDSLKLPPWME